MKKLVLGFLIIILFSTQTNADTMARMRIGSTVRAASAELTINSYTETATTGAGVNACAVTFTGITGANKNGEKMASDYTTVYYKTNVAAYTLYIINLSSVANGGLINWNDSNALELPLSVRSEATTGSYTVDTGTWNQIPVSTNASPLDRLILLSNDDATAGVTANVYYKADFTNAANGGSYGAALIYQLEME
jgi:hypothetical protein